MPRTVRRRLLKLNKQHHGVPETNTNEVDGDEEEAEDGSEQHAMWESGTRYEQYAICGSEAEAVGEGASYNVYLSDGYSSDEDDRLARCQS